MAEVEIKTNNKNKHITAKQKENAVYHIAVRWTPHQLEDKKVGRTTSRTCSIL